MFTLVFNLSSEDDEKIVDDNVPEDGLKVSLVLETKAVVIVPEVWLANKTYLLPLVVVSFEAEVEVIVAQYGDPEVPLENSAWPAVPVVPLAVNGSATTTAVLFAVNALDPIVILAAFIVPV